MMEREYNEAVIEALLFATGRAVAEEELAGVLGVTREEAREIVSDLSIRWASEMRGTEIIELDGAWQMCTRREFYPQLIALELVPKKPRLTDVLMETLSVIAYKQPVTKAEIERIRGVNSDHAVNRLVEYHLVEELGRAKQPGRPILFGTTQEFLRAFGVSSKERLPEISPVLVSDFRAEAESEAGVISGDAQSLETEEFFYDESGAGIPGQMPEPGPEEYESDPAKSETGPDGSGTGHDRSGTGHDRSGADSDESGAGHDASGADFDGSGADFDESGAGSDAPGGSGTELPLIDRGETDRPETVGI